MGEYTHFDADGRPTLVDVGGKSVTKRTARAEGVALPARGNFPHRFKAR